MADPVLPKSRRVACVEVSVPFALNMASSVGLIAVNKVLMSSFGFIWGERQWELRGVRCWRERPEAPLAAVTLCGLHFATTALFGSLTRKEPKGKPVGIPFHGACRPPSRAASRPLTCALPELFLFVLAGNSSVASLNISLKLNSVGVYQVRDSHVPAVKLSSRFRAQMAKISLIPVTCCMERLVFGRHFSWLTIFAVLCVFSGVGLWCVPLAPPCCIAI